MVNISSKANIELKTKFTINLVYGIITLSELTPNQRNDPTALQFSFDRHELSNHLLYRSLPEMKTMTYNTQSPLCIFYDGINHYTAVKPHTHRTVLY